MFETSTGLGQVGVAGLLLLPHTLFYNQFTHGWSDSTVIERRQQQLGRMADILPPVTFSVFDL